MADPREFVGVYEREAEAVLVFLARRTLDAEVALDLAGETFAQASAQAQARLAELEAERRVLERDVELWTTEMRALALEVGQSQGAVARLSDLQSGRPHGDDAQQGGRVSPLRLERLFVCVIAAHRARVP